MRALNGNWWFLILAYVLVSACGGGDSSSPAGTTSSSQSGSLNLPHVKSPVAECLAHSAHSHGIEGTGRRGVVTAVTDTTVTVSTIVFDASNADVFVNGVCATLADIHIGATATVYGDVSDATHTGTATAIYVEEAVVGTIDAIDSAAGTMTVIGQSIVVTSATVLGDDIQPNQLSTLSAGAMVGVSGVVHPDGTIEATRIRRWSQGGLFAVAGVVTTIDSPRQLLRVGAVTVRYTDAQLMNFLDATIHPGDFVRALGQNGIASENTSGIDAVALQRVVIPPPDPSKDIVVQGAISAVRADDDFDVMGQPIKMTPGTRSTGGGPAATGWKSDGAFLTVFGSLDPSGYVIADLVVPQGWGGADITGPITAIDRSAHTLAIMGLPIQLSSYCFLAGESGQSINFDALNIGDELWVEGSPLGNDLIDCLIATQRPPSNEANVYGWKSADRPIIVMTGGIRADTTNAQFYFGHTLGTGCSCYPTTADAFWNYHHLMFVSVRVVGTWTGDHINATKVYWLDE
jgi:hypothetical protein